MRFTKEQYQVAIKNLQDGMRQLEPSSKGCSICGSSGHMAFECGHNPLVAMAICEDIAKNSARLHEILHELAGYNQYMGMQTGPAKIVMPSSNGVIDREQ